jgi:hypothetical protein
MTMLVYLYLSKLCTYFFFNEERSGNSLPVSDDCVLTLMSILVYLAIQTIPYFFFNEEGRVKSLPESDDCVLPEFSVAM